MENWFEKLVGFSEENPAQVRANLEQHGDKITSKINGRTLQSGTLEIISLADQRTRMDRPDKEQIGRVKVSEEIGNVQTFHVALENRDALFQSASQFNLLEMVDPHHTPEDGIEIYQYDRTQGPACAIACGAGTIYRNYFVPVGDQIGQSADRQIDCLEDIGRHFGNEEKGLWKMKNGYALATSKGLQVITDELSKMQPEEREILKGKLKTGIHWVTQVTMSEQFQVVSQIYCSALPVAYSDQASYEWEAFARLILEATYEATFWAAIENFYNTGMNKLFLTLVGGGAFGNREEWLEDALMSNLKKFSNSGLNVVFVSYGESNPLVARIIENYEKDH